MNLLIQINLRNKYMKKFKNKLQSHACDEYRKLNMDNVLEITKNTPILFNRKSKKIITKPLIYIKNDTGFTRHFTPAAQEWHNSICSYNYTYYKSLPVNDINLFSLLKNYFNSHKKKINTAKAKIIKKKGKDKKRGNKNIWPKPMPIMYRRLSTLRTFIGKGDLKHTSEKIILTFYVYNTEGMAIEAKLRKTILHWSPGKRKILHVKYNEIDSKKVPISFRFDNIIVFEAPSGKKVLGISIPEGKVYKYTSSKTKNKKYKTITPEGKKIRTKKKPLIEIPKRVEEVYAKISSTYDYPGIAPNSILWYKQNPLLPEYYAEYYAYLTWYVEKLTSPSKIINDYFLFLACLVEMEYLSYLEESLMVKTELLRFNVKNKKVIIPSFLGFFSFKTRQNWGLYKKLTRKYWKYKWLLIFNKCKFENPFFTQKLINFIEKLYDKKVDLNIVNLKKMHLNSDIFTQAVSLKLRNRDNKVYRVLKASLRKVKVWPINKIKERQKKRNKDDVLVNKIRNNIISSMFTDQDVKDPLSNLLLDFFPSADSLRIKVKKKYSIKIRPISLKNYILKFLKHNKVRGVRIEAKGRLTRRFTASRSIFKLKWKGGLKNVDSSFRGLPAIMLRGYLKSNIQYTVINSKNRNGAYGVKGWVSSR